MDDLVDEQYIERLRDVLDRTNEAATRTTVEQLAHHVIITSAGGPEEAGTSSDWYCAHCSITAAGTSDDNKRCSNGSVHDWRRVRDNSTCKVHGPLAGLEQRTNEAQSCVHPDSHQQRYSRSGDVIGGWCECCGAMRLEGYSQWHAPKGRPRTDKTPIDPEPFRKWLLDQERDHVAMAKSCQRYLDEAGVRESGAYAYAFACALGRFDDWFESQCSETPTPEKGATEK
jgi:hypothetical protein